MAISWCREVEAGEVIVVGSVYRPAVHSVDSRQLRRASVGRGTVVREPTADGRGPLDPAGRGHGPGGMGDRRRPRLATDGLLPPAETEGRGGLQDRHWRLLGSCREAAAAAAESSRYATEFLDIIPSPGLP